MDFQIGWLLKINANFWGRIYNWSTLIAIWCSHTWLVSLVHVGIRFLICLGTRSWYPWLICFIYGSKKQQQLFIQIPSW